MIIFKLDFTCDSMQVLMLVHPLSDVLSTVSLNPSTYNVLRAQLGPTASWMHLYASYTQSRCDMLSGEPFISIVFNGSTLGESCLFKYACALGDMDCMCSKTCGGQSRFISLENS